VTWTGTEDVVDVPFDITEVALAVFEAEELLTLVLTTRDVDVDTTDDVEEADFDEAVVEAAELVAVVVATTEEEVVEAGTLLDAVLEAEEAEARTEEHAAFAALRTATA